MNPEEIYQSVTVSVPGTRVAEFYEMVGRWLAALPDGASIDSLAPMDGVDRASWSKADLHEARFVWSKLTGKARCLFELLMAEPSRRYTGAEIAEHCGIAHGASGVAGTLAWPGRFAYKVERELPVRWKPEDDGDEVPGYWIDPEVADLFSRVRAESA